MNKVLITGINGFVGHHLTRELRENGYDVIGFTRGSDDRKTLSVPMYEGDVLIADHLEEAVKKIRPDYIIHLAAQAKPGYSFSHAQETFEINVFGTLNVLSAVDIVKSKNDGYNPRILLIGTSEEYGDVKEDEMPLLETSVLRPTNPYAISKVACYHLGMQYVRTNKLDIVYAVPFSHIGPGQREGFLIPDVCKQIVEIEREEQEGVLITGPLEVERDYSDVRDVVRGYRLLLEKGVRGERYNLCQGKSVRVDFVVDSLIALSEVVIDHQIDESRRRPTELMKLYGSYQKIHDVCDWTPTITLDKTLYDALESARKKIEDK